MSIDDATKLGKDRIEFKFYAADKYMKDLKELESKGMTFREPTARIECEMLSENLLFHLVGAMDALLVRINDKLALRINNPRSITVENVYGKLGSKNHLLKEAYDMLCGNKSGWLYELTELRNIAMHRSILNLNFTSSSKIVTFVGIHSNLGPIQYLEDSIQSMKGLITKIINKDPLLSTP